jgi:hypothetical protein
MKTLPYCSICGSEPVSYGTGDSTRCGACWEHEKQVAFVNDLQRQRDQARGLACEYASRLARITELLQAIADGHGSVVGSDEAYPELLRARSLAQAALAVASGAAVEVPLRVLVEWALRQQGWERKSDEIEREEAAPAAEVST